MENERNIVDNNGNNIQNKLVVHGNTQNDLPIELYEGGILLGKIESNCIYEYLIDRNTTLAFKFGSFNPLIVDINVQENIEIFLNIDYSQNRIFGDIKRNSRCESVIATNEQNQVSSKSIRVRIPIINNIIVFLATNFLIALFLCFIVGPSVLPIFIFLGIPVGIVGGIYNGINDFGFECCCPHCNESLSFSSDKNQNINFHGQSEVKCPYCLKDCIIDFKNKIIMAKKN